MRKKSETIGGADEAPTRDTRGVDLALQAGTEEHYEDAALYDHEYRRRRADVNYYRGLAAEVAEQGRGARARDVLELGCGTGRLMVPLLRDGSRVVGVDLSQPMLARLEERLARLPTTARRRGTVVRGDFRDLSLGRRFSLVLCPFNAMQHLYTRDDVERFLAVVRRHLAPGGTFAFDVLNPDLRWLTRDPEKRWSRTRFKDPRDGRTYFYSTNHAYDTTTQINWIRIYYASPAAPPGGIPPGEISARARAAGEGGRSPMPASGGEKVIHLAQRQFFPAELEALLAYNGFIIERRDGGFDGERFEDTSDSQVCRCSIGGPSRR